MKNYLIINEHQESLGIAGVSLSEMLDMNNEDLDFIFDLINEKGEKKVSKKSKGEIVKIFIANLPTGNYYLNSKKIFKNGSTIPVTQQIITIH